MIIITVCGESNGCSTKMPSQLFSLLSVLSAVHAGLITNLPGAPPVNFKQYSGFYDVGTNRHIHYWFIESQNQPTTDPVVLWLTGGPGASGVMALLFEIGPLKVNPDGRTLRENPWGWNKKANLLIFESPAGVGYSYADDGNVTTSDDIVAIENREALVDFFKEFLQYQQNEFYVTGESYGGIYIPTLVQTILDKQSQFRINIKGFAIGNGHMSNDLDIDTVIQFFYNHGMIDEIMWQKVGTECCDGKLDGCPFHKHYQQGFGFSPTFVDDVYDNTWGSGPDPFDIFDDCGSDNEFLPLRHQKRFLQERYTRREDKVPPRFKAPADCFDPSAVTTYMNQESVRTALSIPANLPEWTYFSAQVQEKYIKVYTDVTSQVKNAVSQGLRVLLYNGDADFVCNFLMAERFTQELGYPVTKAKEAFQVDGQVGGWHTQYGNVEFEVIRAAGHMVPSYKPAVAYHILDAFLSNRRP